MGAVFFVLGTLIGVWATRIPDIKQILELSESEFGGILLAMASGAVIGFPISGHLVDRFGAARVAKVFAVALVTGFAFLPFALIDYVVVAAFFITGFGIGTLDVSMNGWGAEVEQSLGRPVMSSYHGLYSLGAGAGAGAGVLALWAELSVTAHFIGWCLMLTPLVAFALTTSWTSESTATTEEKPPVFVLPRGALFVAGIMALVAALAEGAVTDWAALYQIQELGFDSSEAAIGFTVFSIAMVAMRLAGDRLIARYGGARVARISGVVAVIGVAFLVSGSNLVVVAVGCAMMGLGNAVIFPLAISRAASEPGLSKGAGIASVALLGYGAFLFGPPVLGFIGEFWSLRLSFVVVGALSLLIIAGAGVFRARS